MGFALVFCIACYYNIYTKNTKKLVNNDLFKLRKTSLTVENIVGEKLDVLYFF